MFLTLSDEIGSMDKALCTRSDGCLQGKHLCGCLSCELSYPFFFSNRTFSLKSITDKL